MPELSGTEFFKLLVDKWKKILESAKSMDETEFVNAHVKTALEAWGRAQDLLGDEFLDVIEKLAFSFFEIGVLMTENLSR